MPNRPSTYFAESGGYMAICLSSLCMDTVTDFDLYFQPGETRLFVLYREKGLPFNEETLQRLKEHRIEQLYIRTADGPQYRRYVEQNLRVILDNPHLKTDEKSNILYSSAQGLVKDVLEDPRSGDLFARTGSMVDNTVNFVFSKKDAFENLLKVTSYDYYTYTHCVNVFMFSIALGQSLGYSADDMHSLGNGALLHDVGKCMIDPEIVNCRGKLSPEQWQEMKLHPVHGHTLLGEQGMDNSIVLDVTRHHHEKLTGAGYPDGLPPSDISEWTRIVTIADIFDALTTRRSYKEALGSFPALKLMREEMAKDLDPDLFRAFVSLMGNSAKK